MTKVAVVLVTFNRADLLRRCLDALSKQSRLPDEVFVVDNCSTDATTAVVDQFGKTGSLSIRYEKLAKNLGGAGGFSFGCRRAFSEGHDFMWLMDDDGVPDEHALEALLACGDGDIRNALVLDVENAGRLAFSLKDIDTRDVSQVKRMGSFLPDKVAPFNGTLVSRRVFETIGFPYQGFFIWGDEIDFVARAKRAGFQSGTVTAAIHYHPSDKKPVYKLFNRFTVATVSDERLKTYMRNYSANYWRFSSKKAWGAFIVKQLTYEVLVKRSPRRFLDALSASFDGAFRFASTVASGARQPFEPDVATAGLYKKNI